MELRFYNRLFSDPNPTLVLSARSHPELFRAFTTAGRLKEWKLARGPVTPSGFTIVTRGGQCSVGYAWGVGTLVSEKADEWIALPTSTRIAFEKLVTNKLPPRH